MNLLIRLGEVWPYIGFICFMIFSTLALRLKRDQIVNSKDIAVTAIIMTMLGPIAVPVAFNMLKRMK